MSRWIGRRRGPFRTTAEVLTYFDVGRPVSTDGPAYFELCKVPDISYLGFIIGRPSVSIGD